MEWAILHFAETPAKVQEAVAQVCYIIMCWGVWDVLVVSLVKLLVKSLVVRNFT